MFLRNQRRIRMAPDGRVEVVDLRIGLRPLVKPFIGYTKLNLKSTRGYVVSCLWLMVSKTTSETTEGLASFYEKRSKSK